MKILICTDGSPTSEMTSALVAKMGLAAQAEITLLGVSEHEDDQPQLAASMDRMRASLGEAQTTWRTCIRKGSPVEQILVQTQENEYDLVVVAWRDDRRLPLLRLGSTAAKLARRIQTHLLVVRKLSYVPQKVLFCTSAESPSATTLIEGGNLVSNLDAEVGLLHVMSQVSLHTSNAPDDLLDTAETAIQRGTREGQYLQDGMDQLRQAGVQGKITPRLRHGLVVDEVLAEQQEGHYDLLVLGSHHQPGQNRWMGILLDDVTDQLLNRALCSVLIV